MSDTTESATDCESKINTTKSTKDHKLKINIETIKAHELSQIVSRSYSK